VPGGGPASRESSGAVVAIAAAAKLAGARRSCEPVHQNLCRGHGKEEELTANSRRCFAVVEERREELAVCGNALGIAARSRLGGCCT